MKKVKSVNSFCAMKKKQTGWYLIFGGLLIFTLNSWNELFNVNSFMTSMGNSGSANMTTNTLDKKRKAKSSSNTSTSSSTTITTTTTKKVKYNSTTKQYTIGSSGYDYDSKRTFKECI